MKKGLLLLISKFPYIITLDLFSSFLVFLGNDLSLKLRQSTRAIGALITTYFYYLNLFWPLENWYLLVDEQLSCRKPMFNSIAIENYRKKGIILLFRIGFSLIPSCCSWMYVPWCRLLFVWLMTRLKKPPKRHHRMTIQTRS